jgi:excisionase family DNA binding protein
MLLALARTTAAGNPRPKEVTAVKTVDESEKLLTPAEVAAMFRVDPKTVTRWAKAGKLSSIRTLGGHRRYREAEIRGLLEESTTRP